MRNLLIFFAIVFFSGCASTEDCTKREEKKAAKSFVKGMDKCPRTMAEMAALVWPVRIYDSVRIEYKPGETKWIPSEPGIVNVDSLLSALFGDKFKGEYFPPIYVPCPPCPVRVDTVETTSNKQGESTAGISALNAKIKANDAEICELKTELSSKEERLKLLYWICGVLGAYTIGRWVLRIWGIKLP